jgi:outer membrane protein OmpA-like peptidoglycan-associated protein
MINNKKAYLVAAGLAVFSPFATAAEPPELQTQAGNFAYVGSNGRIGVGYDTITKLRGEAYWVFAEDRLAAWIGEGWASGSAGGLKLNYHWTPDSGTEKATSQSVRKFFAAVDQNNQRDQKLTLGGGLEQENLFFGAYASTALSGRRTISETSSTLGETISATEQDGRQYSQDIFTTTRLRLYERPYDYGLGARLGRYFNESLIRLSGGLDYEWGRDSSHQTTLSVMLEKFIANSPHSFLVNAEVHQKSGVLEQNRDDQRLYFMYRYEFGGKSYRPEREYRLVQAPVNVAQPTETSAVQPIESPVKIEKRMVKTTAAMLSDSFFEFDSDRLTPQARTALDSVIATLRTAGYSGNIRLTGHTCDLGTTQYNQKLSERRALSIKKYLVDTGKLPAEVMIAEGRGEAEPLYPNTKDLRHKNRRVDLEFVTFTEKQEDVALPPELAPQTTPAKPAKVEWVREYIDTEPAWLRRALHNTTPHKQSVDVYRQQDREVSVASGEKRYLNRAPIAQNDAFSTNRDETAMLDVLANDSDPDQDALHIASITLPAHGNASISGNRISYTPTPGFTGQDTFSYTIADDKGASSSAHVTVTVQAVNQPPVAMDDRYTVPASRDSLLNVLANDRDPDGDALSIVSFTQPNTGSISQGGNGNLVFTPHAGFVSTNFSYTISDGKGGTAPATVTLIDP